MARFRKIWQIDVVKIWQDVAGDLARGTWQDFARFDKGGYGKFGKIWQDLTRGAMERFGKIW